MHSFKTLPLMGSRKMLALMALMALSAVGSAGQTPASGSAKGPRPFTAKYLLVYLDDEGRATTFTGTFYRRGDGSYSRIEETEGPRRVRGTSQQIANLADRSVTSAISFTRTSTTIVQIDDRKLRGFVDPVAGNCANLEDDSLKRIGESEFLGVKVVEVEDRFGEASISRDLLAPELGCFAVRKLLVDHGEVRTIQQVTAIHFGEPNPAAFSVPAGYVEVSPLEFEARWRQIYEGESYYGPVEAEKLERDYQEGKARQRQRNGR